LQNLILKIMKNTKLILALATALCLVSCNLTPTKTNEEENKNKNEEVVETAAPAEQRKVSEKPFEWSFDLMWEVLSALSEREEGRRYEFMEDEYGVQWARKGAEKTYRHQFDKNRLRISYVDMIGYASESEITCFKYQGEDKLYVFLRDQDFGGGGGCMKYHTSLNYDMKTKSLTVIDHPFMKLSPKDFCDELRFADLLRRQKDPNDPEYNQVKKVFAEDPDFEECELAYTFNAEEADLLIRYTDWNDNDWYMDRCDQFAFDWDGHKFVRKPESDVLGTSFEETLGFYGLMFGSEIPQTIKGYSIKPVTSEQDGTGRKGYEITKNGDLIMEVWPQYDEDAGEYTNKVGIVDIYSDRYRNSLGLGVGSLATDVLGAYPQRSTVYLTASGIIMIDIRACRFFVEKDDFTGELPEITEGKNVEIERSKCSFKPDARVVAVRLVKESW